MAADAPVIGRVECDQAPHHWLERIIGGDRHDQRLGEGREHAGGLAASGSDLDREPTRLEGADVHDGVDDAGQPTLVGGDAGRNEGVIARVDGRAAGQQGHGLGRAAEIAQWSEQGIERRGDGSGQVGADPAGAAVGLADQVVALRSDAASDVGTSGGRVHRHDGVAEGHRAVVGVDDATAGVAGGVSADGAVGQRGRAAVVVQAAAGVAGGVSADSAVGQRGRVVVRVKAAASGGGVSADSAARSAWSCRRGSSTHRHCRRQSFR